MSSHVSSHSQEVEKIEEEWEEKKDDHGNRARSCYISAWEKEEQEEENVKVKIQKEDCMVNLLPDYIITSCILSRLPLKAVVRTCVLSRRWRNLWKSCIGTKLIFFDDLLIHKKMSSNNWQVNPMFSEKWWPSYLEFVDCILKSYPHSTMDDFTLRLPLNDTHSYHIDGWLQFALSKGIKRLELEPQPISTLRLYMYSIFDDLNNYVFPGEIELSNWLLNRHVVGSSALANYNNQLTDIKLRYVNIHQSSISWILSHCPFLDRLSISGNFHLVDLEVIGMSLRLRFLEILCCHKLQSIKISAPNLTTFRFHGPASRWVDFTMRLEYVPCLSELFIAGRHTSSMIQCFPHHCSDSYISQLETLTLQLSDWTLKESISFPLNFPKLNKLKHLEVIMHAFDCSDCLLWPTSLIKAAPLLQRFTAKLRYSQDSFIHDQPAESCIGLQHENHVMPTKERIRIQKATHHVHESLKVVELIGFIGCPGDVELAKHLLGIAKSLVKAVFDTSFARRDWQQNFTDYPLSYRGISRKLWDYLNNAGLEIEKLRERLPVDAELVIS